MQQKHLGKEQVGLCQTLLLTQKDGGPRTGQQGEGECESVEASLSNLLSEDPSSEEGGMNGTGLVVFMRSGT